ncbi:MAG: serine/threonine-protein kinase [Cyanobacteriota bacterium]|nr:serine/threonine-protein kinase [Cyanobacteriota bacterium]
MDIQYLPETIIAQRYRILRTLGQGGLGITYRAKDLKNGQHVALKTLSLHRMTDWKALELFEREARILESLNHPSIPRYLDYFQVDASQDHSFYLVQQLAPGQSLAALVEEGWHPDEVEVQQLTIHILEILIYLQSLTPPVIHRDIKPQNIIKEGNEGNEEIRVFLVDFGAVQDTYRHTIMGGSTVVGTYGYMAPEQFRGEAFLSTDLYGLGTTLLFLLTSKSPAELPQRKLKIDFRDRVRVSRNFANWLEKMLEPIVEDRFQTATEALAALKGELAFTYSLSRSEKPKGTPIVLKKVRNQLAIDIPSVWLRNTYSLVFALLPLLPALSFIALGLLSVLVVSISAKTLLAISFILLELYFCSWVPTFSFLFRSLMNVRLKFDRETCSLEWYWLSSLWGTNRMNGNTSDLHEATLSQLRLPFARQPFTFCVLHLKRRKIRFGLFLTRQENEWLAGEINGFLEEMRSRIDQHN